MFLIKNVIEVLKKKFSGFPNFNNFYSSDTITVVLLFAVSVIRALSILLIGSQSIHSQQMTKALSQCFADHICADGRGKAVLFTSVFSKSFTHAGG